LDSGLHFSLSLPCSQSLNSLASASRTFRHPSINILVYQLLHRRCVVPEPGRQDWQLEIFPCGSTQFQDLSNVLANSDQKFTRASMNLVDLDESAAFATTVAGKLDGTVKTGSAMDAKLPLYMLFQ